MLLAVKRFRAAQMNGLSLLCGNLHLVIDGDLVLNDHIAGDNLSMADGPFIPASGRWKNEKRSQFARVSFDFLDRYIVSASFRRDGSDKFFPGKKYALFSSVSAAWKISDEPWMANVTAVNLLKLRASWGETGSDNLGTTL